MALTAPGFVHQGEINSAVLRVERSFSAQVFRIGLSFGEDASGALAIFFRILIRNEAAAKTVLRDLAQRLSIALMNEVRTDESMAGRCGMRPERSSGNWDSIRAPKTRVGCMPGRLALSASSRDSPEDADRGRRELSKTKTDPISISSTRSLRWLARITCQIIRTVG